jgi:cellulose biosynthesis protein BcsQ
MNRQPLCKVERSVTRLRYISIDMVEPSPDAEQKEGNVKSVHDRADCVIVDTNELLSSLLLNNAMGAALLFEVQKQNGKLGWPEVINGEIRKHATLRANKAIQQISSELHVLEILVGWRPDPTLPSKEEINSAINQRIVDLAPLLISMPFTIEHARAALQRVSNGTPPNNDKNHQFKDSAIWEAILELADRYRIHFVTKDTGFYQERDLKKGLAKELSDECRQAGFEVHLYPGLVSCVEALRKVAPPLDYAAIVVALDCPLRIELSPEIDKRDFALGETTNSVISAFRTEHLGIWQ